MKPTRILQVLTIMNRGGAETMIMNYYRALDRSMVQFDFLLHRTEKGAFDDEIKAMGGRIFYMPAINPKNYFEYKKKLNIFFKNHSEYNVVHSHLNALSGILLSVAKKQGIKIRIAHAHLAVEPYAIKKIFYKNTDIKATVKDSIQSVLRFTTPKHATHYFACGKKAGTWLFGEKLAPQVTVINNAIHTENFSFNIETRNSLKAELKLENKKVIGHVGRFNEQKNHFFLLDIFKEVIKSHHDTVLVLIGDGNLRTKLEEKVAALQLNNHVRFLGVRTDIAELLQVFDVFLFPSLYEGLPVTLVEAQAAGLKIVASNTITNEVDITNTISFLPLEASPKTWAKTILNSWNYERVNTFDQIKNGKYDIHENAKSLENFYLKNSTYVRN